MFKSQNLKTLPLCLGVILAISLVNYLVLAWTEPSQTPPGGNVNAPINVGNTGQSKAGGLILNTGGAATGLVVDKGNVGIGTTNPTQALDVSGKIIMRSETTSTDPNNTVVTKGYLSSLLPSLYNNNHTSKECTDRGGIVSGITGGTYLCQFLGGSCPSGWSKYIPEWTSTGPHYCEQVHWANGQACTTGSHSWGAIVQETCDVTYWEQTSRIYYPYYTCYAIITSVGCY